MQRPVSRTSLLKRQRITIDDVTPYLMIAPVLIGIAIVSLYPSFRSIWMSFFNINLLKPKTPFCGLDNYVKFFAKEENLRTLANTGFWTVMSVALGTVVAMIIALQLNKPFRGRSLLRALYMAPWVIPPIVVANVWSTILNKDVSPINGILMQLKLIPSPIAFLADPTIYFGFISKPMLYLILINLWNMQPFMIVMFLAGLQTVPEELYEASMMDGANKRQQFRHVTMPLLMPVMETTLLLQCIWQFNSFNLSYLVTNGGPVGTTQTMAVLVYNEAMIHYKYGSAGAISVIMVLITAIPSILYVVKVIRSESNIGI